MEEILKLVAKNPEMVMPIVKEYINKYKPIVYDLCNELMNVYKDYADNTEFAETVAKVKRNQYDAYINEGFTPEQAMTFMLNTEVQMIEQLKNINTNTKRA